MENISEKSENGPKKVVSINENLENPFTAFLTITFFYVFSGKYLNNQKMDMVELCPKTPRRKKFWEKNVFLFIHYFARHGVNCFLFCFHFQSKIVTYLGISYAKVARFLKNIEPSYVLVARFSVKTSKNEQKRANWKIFLKKVKMDQKKLLA